MHKVRWKGDGEVGYLASMVCIVGKAREGKSTLMNVLAQKEGLFQISNETEACTGRNSVFFLGFMPA